MAAVANALRPVVGLAAPPQGAAAVTSIVSQRRTAALDKVRAWASRQARTFACSRSAFIRLPLIAAPHFRAAACARLQRVVAAGANAVRTRCLVCPAAATA